jgi:hypothetical protein
MADRMDIIARNGNDGEHYAESELTYREVCDAVAARNQEKRTQIRADRTQIGGEHYKLPIQPIDFIVKNNIPFREANIIKYVVRYKNKNGIEDLKKARHYLDMIIEDYNANL